MDHWLIGQCFLWLGIGVVFLNKFLLEFFTPRQRASVDHHFVLPIPDIEAPLRERSVARQIDPSKWKLEEISTEFTLLC